MSTIPFPIGEDADMALSHFLFGTSPPQVAFEDNARRLVLAVRSLDTWGAGSQEKFAHVLQDFERHALDGHRSPAWKSATALLIVGREQLARPWDDRRTDALHALAELVLADLGGA